MQDSVFTRILKGELPCHKIFEDQTTFAFLSIVPIQPGHVLVIPKKQIEQLWELSEADYDAVMATTRKVGQRIREVLQPWRVGVQVTGVEVPHVHVHVFPFNTLEESRVHPENVLKPSDDDLATMAQRLRMVDEL